LTKPISEDVSKTWYPAPYPTAEHNGPNEDILGIVGAGFTTGPVFGRPNPCAPKSLWTYPGILVFTTLVAANRAG
jgi:hypothetical protein